MSPTALLLVLVAAVLHATWNLLAKQALGPSVVFVWSYSATAVLGYGPLAIVALVRSGALPVRAIVAVVASGLMQVAYALVLQRAYQHGDLSLVYPVARGSAPVLTLLLGVIMLGEPLSPGLAAGVVLVTAGIVVVGTAHGTQTPRANAALAHGLATGAVIAGYGVWDKHVVSTLAVAPIVLDWGANLVRTVVLWPRAWRHRGELMAGWRTNRRQVMGVGLLSPLAYLLVLTVLRTEPVTRVSPLREVSIVVAAALGTWVAGEPAGRRRILGAMIVLAGAFLLAVG